MRISDIECEPGCAPIWRCPECFYWCPRISGDVPICPYCVKYTNGDPVLMGEQCRKPPSDVD